ncbi:RAB2A isoform 7, partial [Pongo abelii]
VGKSCLLLQFTDKRFQPVHDLTIGTKHLGGQEAETVKSYPAAGAVVLASHLLGWNGHKCRVRCSNDNY